MRGILFSREFHVPKLRWRPLSILFLIFIATGNFAYSQCNYTIELSDDYGDGWNGSSSMDVLVDGNVVLNDIKISSGYSASYTFSVSTGQDITTVFNPSAASGYPDYASECGFRILDASNTELFSSNFEEGDGPPEDVTTGTITASCPSCSAPSGLSASNITTETANLSWTSDGSTFDISWGEGSFAAEDGTIEAGFANGGTLSGLNSNTAYQYYVRQNCGGGDLSAWAGPFAFLTPPGCGDNFYDSGGSTSNYGDSENYTVTIYPDVVGDLVSVTFTSFNTENGWDGLMIYDGDSTSAPLISSGSTYGRTTCPNGAWTGTSTYSANGQTFTSTHSSGALTFVFTSDGGTNYSGWEASVSCAPPPSCLPPINISLVGVSDSGADFSWDSISNAEGYNWFVFANGADPEVDTALFSGNVSGTTATVSGLADNTAYDFYVMTDCGTTDGESTYSDKVDFTTLLAPAAVPWNEEFATTSAPAGWTTTGWSFTGSTATLPGTEGNYIYKNIWNAGSSGVSFRTINVGTVEADNVLSFDYSLKKYNGTKTVNGNFVVGISVDGGSNFTDVETITYNSDLVWTPYSIDLSSYIGQYVTVRITGNWGGGSTDDYYLGFDNFFIGIPPTCVPPTGITLDDVTAHEAEFSWDAIDNAEGYNWFVFENDADTESATPVASGNTTELTATATGLDPQTDYDFYVQTDCGSDGTSDLSIKVDFTTACVAVTDFNENFDAGSTGTTSNPNLPSCWSFIDSGAGYGYVYNFSTPNTTPNHFYLYNSSDNSGNYILVSPETVDLGNGENWVRFYAKGATNYTLQVGTLSDASDPGTFTVLETISLTSTYTEYFVELPAGTDDYIGFRHGLGGTYRSIYLDNIVFEEAPSCIAPTGLTLGDVDGHTAEFSWSAIDNAEGYNWFVFANDADPESATPVASGSTTEISVTVSGLDPETEYDFYVQTDCGSEDGTSELSAKVDFTTTVACPAPTNLSHTQLSVTSAELSWESSGNTFELKWGASDFDIETEGTLVDDLTETSYTLEELTTDADYEFYVRSDCGAEDGVSVWAGPYSFSVGYCTVNPPSSNDATGITYVGFNTIDNPSGTGTNNTTDHVYYSDFTNISTEVQAGGAYDLSVRLNTAGAYTVWATAWIDWNGDGVFDTVSEAYNLGSVNGETDGPTSNSPLSIQIPMTASGEYRMRIKAAYGETTVPDPCLTQGWSETEDYTINVTGPVTWTGTEWINGTPAEDVSVLINGGLSIENDAPALEVNNMLISGTGSVTVEPGNTLTVNGKITNENSAASFVVENGGNLIQTNNDTNSGAITVKSESQPMIRLDYTLWSSPVIGQNLFNFSPETVNGVTNYPGATGRIYIYDGANGYVNPDPFLADTNMNNGTGYLFRSPNNFDASVPEVYEGVFTGTPINGDLSVATVAGNYTSIGNPYPSNLDADLLLDENLDIETLYLWVNTPLVDGEYTGTNYATYTDAGGAANAPGGNEPSGIVAVGQGFIVKTSGTAVNFNNSMRTNSDTDFFKTADVERHRFWLNLFDGNNNGLNQILIAYMEGATMGIDNQLDGKMFGYEGSALYSIIDGDSYTIQGRSLPFENSDVVPLGFRAAQYGKFLISLANSDGLFAEGQSIYLKDNLLGVQHKLNNSAYEFESEEGTFKDRFEIVYVEDGMMGVDDLTANGVLIYKNQDFIEVSSKVSPIDSVEIYDLQGRKIFSQDNIKASKFQINAKHFGTQVLVVNVTTENGVLSNKKMVNK